MPKTPESIRRIATEVGDRVRSLSANARDRSRDRFRRASIELQSLPSKLTPKMTPKSKFLTPDFNARGRSPARKVAQVKSQDRMRSGSRAKHERARTLSHTERKRHHSTHTSRSLSSRRPTHNLAYNQGRSNHK